MKCPAGLAIAQPGRFHEAFAETALAATVFRNDTVWTLEYLFETCPDGDFLRATLEPLFREESLPVSLLDTLHVEEVDAGQDWLDLCYRALPAFSCGKFFIYGSHCGDEIPEGQIGLQIDAVQAFGSGTHGTTYGCLQLLQDLAANENFTPRRILDMGTGSGILAIGAAYLWDAPVVASDIEEESAAATARHAASNNVSGRIDVLHATGFDHPAIKAGAPYDLIIANILPSVLAMLRADIIAHAAEGAFILLSGIPDDQAAGVLDLYNDAGCSEISRISREKWTSLLLRRGE